MKKTLGIISLLGLAMAGCRQSTEPTANQPTMPQSESQIVSTASAAGETAPNAGRFVNVTADTATIKVKFVYEGKPPAPKKIDSSKDSFCANLNITSEAILVGTGGELQNVAMYWDLRANRKVEIPKDMLVAEKATITLDNRGCIFRPHIFAARPGQTIQVINSDQAGHNANFGFIENEAANNMIPAGGSKDVELKLPEPAPIPVDCNIHPWMKSYLIVTEHPFVGISNEKGELTIENVPVGEVVFKIWHEHSAKSIDEITIHGKKQKTRRGQLELDLKPGLNDLGTIKIAADKFDP